MLKLILGLEIFIFILSCLNVIRHIFKLSKVLWTKNGKITENNLSILLLGMSISYIITQLIIGF